MKCKTSCFNPSLAKNDLRRFWPLPVCSFFLFLFSLVLPFYRYVHEGASEGMQQYFGPDLPRSITVYLSADYLIQALMLAALALVAALLLFQHLHGKKEIQFYLGLPMRRSGLYLTSLLTGFGMILVPMALCYGLLAGICLHFGISPQSIGQLLLISILLLLLFYGMSVLACVLAGQRFGAFLLYAGMHGAALVIWMGLAQVAECFIPGFSASVNPPQWLVWLIPFVRLFSDSILDAQNVFHLSMPLVYGIVGLVLLVLSGVLYQIRRAETAGDMLSFAAVKILSKVLAALAVGLGGFALLQLVAFPSQTVSFGVLMLLVLVLIAVGWIAAEMIIQKSFRIFHSRSMLAGGALLLITAAVMLGAKSDALGYVHRIPASDQVESASISMAHYQGYDFVEVSPEDALSLHETILSHLDQLTGYDGDYSTLQLALSYGLKDGSTMERTYYFSESALPELEQTALSILSQPENVAHKIFSGWDAEPSIHTFFMGSVSAYYDDSNMFYFTNTDRGETYLTAQEAIALYDAICQDIEDGNVISPVLFYNFSDDNSQELLGSIYLSFFKIPYDAATGSYSLYQETAPQQSADIDLQSTMTHTIAAMEDMGFQFR